LASSAYQGSLFSNDFVETSIAFDPDWVAIAQGQIVSFRRDLQVVFDRFPTTQTPNETQTEDDLIWRVLAGLGWSEHLRQQNLTTHGRQDVPDGILYIDAATKDRAVRHPEEWRRYEFGAAIVESKRWGRPLDRRSEQRNEIIAPSTQMLRYLRRVDDLTNGSLRWGILTNGHRWRLYYSGARSVSEQFFEIDLAAVLGVPGFNEGPFALTADEQAHWLTVFLVMFRREAFVPGPDHRTFHQRALDEGRFYEERVAQNLSDLVFGTVFPQLAQGIAQLAEDAELHEVRDAALVLLYRLLFILYAEDRDLLPLRDNRYDNYSLRDRVRLDVRRRKDAGDVFSATAARYWSVIDDLCRAIDGGDVSVGLPPYNGGLFSKDGTPLLDRIRLGDALIASVVDTLSFMQVDGQRRYINYRDLSVQQLGSIYERLLEHEIVREDGEVRVRPNIFARKGSGSYYTPDDLVSRVIDETLYPLIERTKQTFRERLHELEQLPPANRRIGSLTRVDPAMRLLELKICDPAMGSGHFPVSLVDKLADHIIEAMAEAGASVEWGDYVSPLAEKIETVRNTIFSNAEARGWAINEDQLDDRHIIRRMVLKRCVYGVDKNPMAVELAKVSLWLHTFTVGAPLSFLDHHLRTGDSLFGSWVRDGIEKVQRYGSPLLLHKPIRAAVQSAAQMQIVEGLTDAEIAEAEKSSQIFDQITEMTGPLNALLSFIHALDWLNLRGRDNIALIQNFFDGDFGDPVRVLLGQERLRAARDTARFAEIFEQAKELIDEERFLHWQVAFPGIWSDWQGEGLTGGFDAIVGNPPWDRLKLQQVEWFAAREPRIAMAQRASDRKSLIAELVEEDAPLARDFEKASRRAEAASRMAREAGDYPLLSGGDTNINSLFIERAKRLCKADGMVGLLVPSGIATETSSQRFFSELIENGNVKCVYDFFNKRADGRLFFPDVYYRFKFSALVFSPSAVKFSECRFATFVRDVADLDSDGVTFAMGAEHFAHVNPNTQTAPVYRAGRDKELSTIIYERMPILIDKTGAEAVRTWPVRYLRMFDMANDSDLFRTRTELEEKEGAFPVSDKHFRNAAGTWAPLYEGKMVQAFDHRASSIVTVSANVHRSGQGLQTSDEEHQNPKFRPEPRYFILEDRPLRTELALKDVTSTTNARSIIACMIPPCGAGHTLPLIQVQLEESRERAEAQSLLLANLNSIPLDFVARTKILSNHASWYIIEQLPVVPPEDYRKNNFGEKSAASIAQDIVLELTYTAHDMAAFAHNMGYVEADGKVKTPFMWDEERRLHLRAKLDAMYFHLYGINNRSDVRYIYSTFPIVEREEGTKWGSFRSRDLCLAYMNALAAGHPDAVVDR